MTDKEMLHEMITMQMALDDAICKEKGLVWNDSKYNTYNLRLAIIDEIGEFTHELKADWCWWKNTQKPVDRDRVLEELVDIWHFVMSMSYHWWNDVEGLVDYSLRGYDDYKARGDSYFFFLKFLFSNEYDTLNYLILLTKEVGFTIEDIYEAYKKKNQINYERLERGY